MSKYHGAFPDRYGAAYLRAKDYLTVGHFNGISLVLPDLHSNFLLSYASIYSFITSI